MCHLWQGRVVACTGKREPCGAGLAAGSSEGGMDACGKSYDASVVSRGHDNARLAELQLNLSLGCEPQAGGMCVGEVAHTHRREHTLERGLCREHGLATLGERGNELVHDLLHGGRQLFRRARAALPPHDDVDCIVLL